MYINSSCDERWACDVLDRRLQSTSTPEGYWREMEKWKKEIMDGKYDYGKRGVRNDN